MAAVLFWGNAIAASSCAVHQNDTNPPNHITVDGAPVSLTTNYNLFVSTGT